MEEIQFSENYTCPLQIFLKHVYINYSRTELGTSLCESSALILELLSSYLNFYLENNL